MVGYPSPGHGTWIPYPPEMGPGFSTPLLPASGGHHWGPVQACSLGNLPHGTDSYWWPPKHIKLASRQYASYWNAVLFFLFEWDFNQLQC